jgi:hypothetical protein
MLDLHLYFSASVNVRYVLHTQSLKFIYNKILVRVSLYPFLSLSILCWIILLTPTPLSTVSCQSLHLHHPFFHISSTPTLSIAKEGICNANGHGNNNAMNPPPLD